MRNFLFATFSLLFILGCEVYEEPVRNNPIDPQSESFTPPKAEINATFESMATINSTTVTLNWDGIFENSNFSYKLSAYDADFTDWTSEKSITYNYLDEGQYTFLVREKAADFEQETPDSITFTIDAIQEPALIIKKWHTAVNENSDFTLDLALENIENLNGLSTKLNFSIEHIELAKIEALKNNVIGGAESVAFISNEVSEANATGLIEIDMLLLGNADAKFSGSANFCRFHFKARNEQASTVEFDAAQTKLRDQNNEPIEVNLFREAVIK